jgi:hypothetical protein
MSDAEGRTAGAPDADSDVNDRIELMLREAAEKREARARAQSIEDQSEAGRQLEAAIKLAKSQSKTPIR